MIDHTNKTWTREGDLLTCEDGRTMSIAPAMTDAYLLALIARMDKPPVPQAVTMRQARLALLAGGLLPAVAAAIASMPSPQKEAATIEWEYSQTVERNRPFVLLLGQALGLDDAALDELFILAATL